jgi:hypothetical protein
MNYPTKNVIMSVIKLKISQNVRNERLAIRPYILKIRSQNFGVIPPNRR